MTAEPDMESLLASIRKAIDSDIGKNSKSSLPVSQDTPFKGAMRELRVKFDDNLSKPRDASAEISELRSKIQKNRGSAGIAEPMPRLPSLPNASPPPPPPPASKSGFAGILGGDAETVPWAPRIRHDVDTPSLRPTIQDHLPPSQNYQGSYEETEIYPEEVGWIDDEPAYVPAAALMSSETSEATESAFNQLADTLMARALGERTIEDMTQDLLRGMLRSWLDSHLPALVEKLVREEIERVARRGR